MQPTEHRAKYEALARRLGVDALLAIMPATPVSIDQGRVGRCGCRTRKLL